MKTTFIREFADPRDAEEFFADLSNHPKVTAALWDYAEFLRSKLKYEELSDEAFATFEQARQKLFELLKEHDAKIGFYE